MKRLSKDNGSSRDIVTFEKQENENASPTSPFFKSPASRNNNNNNNNNFLKKQIVMSRSEADKPSFLNQLVKVAIAITIFGAVTYGEGWVNYTALAALFLVYVVAIG